MIAICIISAAFCAAIIRAGFDSIHQTQWETAAVMNVGRMQTLVHVVLPQAWRVILPPAFAFMVMFIKATALASQLGVVELTSAGKVLSSRGFPAILVFGTVLVLYFLLSYPLSRLGGWLEGLLAPSRRHWPRRRLFRHGGAGARGRVQVHKGEIVSLIGPSGSGKSTLLRVLVGLLPPIRGEVRIDGEAIDYASRRSLKRARDRLAIVLQQCNLFQNMTAMGNVTIAPIRIKGWKRAEVEADAARLSAKVGLSDKHRSCPDQLSGGQQQRVAIARAPALSPRSCCSAR